jgi:hypothetical protein
MLKLRQDVYHAQTRRSLLDNTLTVKIGDVIAPLASTSGVVTNATAGVAGAYYPYGLVVGFSGPNGEVVGGGLASVGTTTPAQVITIGTNQTAAWNGTTTGGQICAVYVPITPEMEFSGTMNHAAGYTQAYSGLAFNFYNLADAGDVDETSVIQYSAGITTPLQILSVPNGVSPTSALDPLDTANLTLIFRFVKTVYGKP